MVQPSRRSGLISPLKRDVLFQTTAEFTPINQLPEFDMTGFDPPGVKFTLKSSTVHEEVIQGI